MASTTNNSAWLSRLWPCVQQVTRCTRSAIFQSESKFSWQWRHNGHEGVSNPQPHDCLLNCLYRRRSKKTSKLRVTGLCAGNSPVTGEFLIQISPLAYAALHVYADDDYCVCLFTRCCNGTLLTMREVLMWCEHQCINISPITMCSIRIAKSIMSWTSNNYSTARRIVQTDVWLMSTHYRTFGGYW